MVIVIVIVIVSVLFASLAVRTDAQHTILVDHRLGQAGRLSISESRDDDVWRRQ